MEKTNLVHRLRVTDKHFNSNFRIEVTKFQLYFSLLLNKIQAKHCTLKINIKYYYYSFYCIFGIFN
jgi:hypothetical protein